MTDSGPRSEIVVIAGLLHYSEVRPYISVTLRPEHFTHPALIDAYRATLELHAAGMEISAEIVKARLSDEHRSRIDDAGDLGIAIPQPPTREDIDVAVNEMLKRYARRQIATVCQEILADPDSAIQVLRATVYESDSEAVTDAFVRLVAVLHDSAAEPWPEPQRLKPDLLPVDPFDLKLLPECLRALVSDVADRMQCPPDFVAVAVLVVLGTVVGRKIGIRPKREDDWLVVPNLWGGIIGRPSVLKSPAIKAALDQLVILEIEAKEQYEGDVKRFEHEQAISQAAAKENEAMIRKKLQKGESPQSIAETIPRIENPDAPTRKRLLVNDATVEKLGVILAENPNGVLVFRDELVGFLRSLEREKQEQARAFYLEAWNGIGRFTYDRIGRGTIDIEAAIVSVFGAIPPGPFRRYVCEAIEHGAGDDGLMQRFQLLVYPDIDPNWENIDRPPDKEARRKVADLIRDLSSTDGVTLGGVRDEDADGSGRDGIPYLRFDDEAQTIFDKWRTKLELRLREPEEHPAFESHLGKYRSLVPSLALLLHLADGGKGPVTRTALDRSIGWVKYLESHARRIYAATLPTTNTSVRALAKKLLTRKLPVPFGLRDVYRAGWADLTTKDQAEEAVDALRRMGWLRIVHENFAQKSVTRYLVNPRIHERPPGGPDKPDKPDASDNESPVSVLSVGSACDSPDSQGAKPPDVEKEATEATPEGAVSVLSVGTQRSSSDFVPSSTPDSADTSRTDTDRTDTDVDLSVLSVRPDVQSSEPDPSGTDSDPVTLNSGGTPPTDTDKTDTGGEWDTSTSDRDFGQTHQPTTDKTDRPPDAQGIDRAPPSPGQPARDLRDDVPGPTDRELTEWTF
jgi:putative DNA primase/helicase